MSRLPQHILVVAPWAPWPITNGATLRAGKLLEALGQRTGGVLVSPGSKGGAWPLPESFGHRPFEPVAVTPERSPLRLIGKDVWPFTYDPVPITAAVERAWRVSGPFDAALTWSGADLSVLEIVGTRSCLDLVDARSAVAWRKLRYPESLKAASRALRELLNHVQYERRVAARFELVLVAGAHDRRTLARRGLRGRVEAVANGVDTGYFQPKPDLRSAEPTVIFTGTLNYPPNVDAALYVVRTIWPLVRAQIPDARLMIAGRNPVDEVLALVGDGVEVHRDVPDMRVPLASSWIAIAPMRTGTGIKNKILEAWAMGLPVVTTTLGANGVEDTVVEAGILADQPQSFAEGITRLLRDPRLRDRIGEAARGLCEVYHTWDAMAERVHRLLGTVRP